MSMEHKAFIFDYESFMSQLSSILEQALATGDNKSLVSFIRVNVNSLKDPYEGELLNSDWESMIQPKNAHQYGDFALTKFYDPKSDIGLDYEWETIEDILDHELGTQISPILGKPFGPKNNYFDPGKMGSYFQSLEQVQENLQELESFIQKKPNLSDKLEETIEVLRQAVEAGKGLYVTF